MSGLWLVPAHIDVAGHDWLIQIAVFALIGGIWLFAAGHLERRAAARQRRRPGAGPAPGPD